ncbi:hypothetical protein GUITHDRAFT_139398 [Guillardia theta CCMP2712]|uniref:CID domain-containing protein n=1 Tax=Guillardia theta (strain CCMP2712) TaxID=905079 RepID=L1J9M8_GUITC|nr:hypothetical protein GUITHDRAFT_139398 [Guillardia theta CCMP2712]EKX44765.1 hypothetical protein GUITHDRAFT_139398 [Guillardia theta CCMP2712]|eukprot:XP_005831745.1 hypothetical protein GUITHDRAFT_139398 [Guillardia theta CCMP2712]
MDPAAIEFLQSYESELVGMQRPDKGVINVLTMLASDNIDAPPVANGIVACIEKCIRMFPPNKKLIPLYLMDSIVKNVGAIYTHLFVQNLTDIFCTSFAAVDNQTRASYIKLLDTWKAQSVFPPAKNEEIRTRLAAMLQSGIPSNRPGLDRRPEPERRGMMPGVPGNGSGMMPGYHGGGMHPAVGMNPMHGNIPNNPVTVSSIQEQQTLLQNRVYGLVNSLMPQQPAQPMGLSGLPPNMQMIESHLLPQPNPLQQLLEDFQLQQGLKDAVGVKDSVEEYAPRQLNSKDLNSREVLDVVYRLYEGQPFICKTDGRRFRSQEDLSNHLDRLFEINRAKKENLGARERHWFKVISEWTACKDLVLRKPVDLKVQVDGQPPQESAAFQESVVPADDGAFTGDPRCSACSEKMKKEYDKEEDRWVFRGAVRVNGNGQVDSAGLFLVHQKCYQEGATYSDVHVASTPRTQEALSSWGS